MARANLKIADVDETRGYLGGGNHYLIQVPPNKVYVVYIDMDNDLRLAKSTNNGLTWDEPTGVVATTNNIMQYSCWYDNWSDINSSNLIHIVYGNSVRDYFYINYNTSTDTFSSATTIAAFAGLSFSNYFGISVTRAKGGNLGFFYSYLDDSFAVATGFYTSSNIGNTWSPASSPGTIGTALPNGILLPEFSSNDSQDMMMISQIEAQNTIYKRFYDSSVNTWITSSFGTSSFPSSVSTYGFPYISAFPDKVNSQSVVVAWNASSYPSTTTGAKLQCFTITSASVTEKTLIATSSTSAANAVATCGVSYNTLDGNWYVYYGGKPSGGETRQNCNIYYRQSSNQGTTWSSELPLTLDIPSIFNTQSFGLSELVVPPIVTTYNMIAFANYSSISDVISFYINTPFPTDGGSIVIS
jgi:hypothetical protein